ncbi:unnamed protein product, partial [Ectocarpus sp. 13 AM-2016]
MKGWVQPIAAACSALRTDIRANSRKPNRRMFTRRRHEGLRYIVEASNLGSTLPPPPTVRLFVNQVTAPLAASASRKASSSGLGPLDALMWMSSMFATSPK